VPTGGPNRKVEAPVLNIVMAYDSQDDRRTRRDAVEPVNHVVR
jgi:hypothetical protein